MLDQPHASRRALLTVGSAAAGAAALPLLAGCDLDGRRPAWGPPTDEAPSADEDVRVEAVTEVAAVSGLVDAVRGGHPTLRARLAGLHRLHAAHAEVLDVAWMEETGPGRAGAPQAALQRVRRRELAHQRRLADLAVRAESGQLAQLLASMSAAVAQHVTALPREVRR